MQTDFRFHSKYFNGFYVQQYNKNTQSTTDDNRKQKIDQQFLIDFLSLFCVCVRVCVRARAQIELNTESIDFDCVDAVDDLYTFMQTRITDKIYANNACGTIYVF